METAKNFEEILVSISHLNENNNFEFIFPAGMIEAICKEKNYPCYKFAHNLEGDSYMRARVNRITLEFLVRSKKENEKESAVLQIRNNGERIYYRPENPVWTIYVI